MRKPGEFQRQREANRQRQRLYESLSAIRALLQENDACQFTIDGHRFDIRVFAIPTTAVTFALLTIRGRGLVVAQVRDGIVMPAFPAGEPITDIAMANINAIRLGYVVRWTRPDGSEGIDTESMYEKGWQYLE